MHVYNIKILCKHFTIFDFVVVVVVQSLSHAWLFATHELQHGRLLCSSLSSWICSNSCPLIQWCHSTTSSSVAPFSSCPQSFPASGSFLTCQFFTIGGQILVLQLQHQSFLWIFRVDFLWDWLVWSLCSPRNSRIFSSTTTVRKHQFFSAQLCF